MKWNAFKSKLEFAPWLTMACKASIFFIIEWSMLRYIYPNPPLYMRAVQSAICGPHPYITFCNWRRNICKLMTLLMFCWYQKNFWHSSTWQALRKPPAIRRTKSFTTSHENHVYHILLRFGWKHIKSKYQTLKNCKFKLLISSFIVKRVRNNIETSMTFILDPFYL